MPAKLHSKWRPKSRLKKMAIGLAAIALGAVGAGVPEVATNIVKKRADVREQNAAKVFDWMYSMYHTSQVPPRTVAAKESMNKEVIKSRSRYTQAKVKRLQIARFQLTIRPYYISGGALAGLLTALGVGIRRRKVVLRKVQGRYADVKIVSPKMYDSSEITNLIKNLGRTFRSKNQATVFREIEGLALRIRVPYLSEAMKSYENYILLGDTFVFFNESKPQKQKP